MFLVVWPDRRGGQGGEVLLVYLTLGGFSWALGMSWSLEALTVLHTVIRIRWERIISSAWRMEMKARMFSFFPSNMHFANQITPYLRFKKCKYIYENLFSKKKKKKKSCLPSGKLFRRSLTSSIYSVVKLFEINFKSSQPEGERLSAHSSAPICHSSMKFIKFSFISK